MYVCAKSLQLCTTLCDPMDCSLPGPSVHGDSTGKSTGVVCHLLLQGNLPDQGSNLHLLWLLHWQAGSLPLAPPGRKDCYIHALKKKKRIGHPQLLPGFCLPTYLLTLNCKQMIPHGQLSTKHT